MRLLLLLAAAAAVDGWALGRGAGLGGRRTTPLPTRTSPAHCSLNWRSASSGIVEKSSWQQALDSVTGNLTAGGDGSEGALGSTDLLLLFLPQHFSEHLHEATAEAARRLNASCAVGAIGAGVIGGGIEVESEASISAVAGQLPTDSCVRPFVVSTESLPVWGALASANESAEGRPGFLLFADPFSPVTQTLACLDAAFPASVVAGGLSCPQGQAPSLALYTRGALCRMLPVGSLAGISLQGPNLEVHSVCAQGATAVGPTFTVTKGNDNLVEEIDGKPALAALQQTAAAIGSMRDRQNSERLLRLLAQGLLYGTPVGEEEDGDYLVRPIMGGAPGGALVLGSPVTPGHTRIRFHVRDAIAAEDDLRLRLDRYRIGRQFAGRGLPAAPLAAILFACNGRGRRMYAQAPAGALRHPVAAHDSVAFGEAISSETAIGGFFCNGELGSVGAAGLANPADEHAAALPTYLHGFTSVYAMLYDTSKGTDEGEGEGEG